MASEEPEERESGVELVPLETAKQLAELLAGVTKAAEPTEEEIEEMRFAVIYEMASAETEADLWKELQTWSTKDNVDRAFEIRDVRVWRSKFQSKAGKGGAFMSCPAVDLETGEIGILNTSAMRLCGRIGWYKIHNQLPVKLRIVKVGESANGFTVLDGRLIAESTTAVPDSDGVTREVVEDAEYTEV